MSLLTVRRCDVCGRRETDYGAVKAHYAEIGGGRHVCCAVCALVLLATWFNESREARAATADYSRKVR